MKYYTVFFIVNKQWYWLGIDAISMNDAIMKARIAAWKKHMQAKHLTTHQPLANSYIKPFPS